MGVIDLIVTIRSKLFNRTGPFLSDDCSAAPSASYPYPARLPCFLAVLGLHEIERWPQVAAARKELLSDLLNVAKNTWMWSYIPKAYLNKRLEIVPLRLAWTQPDGDSVREHLSHFVHVAWTWFLQPIITTSEPLESFGYRKAACPVSERIGPGMVNLPCNLGRSDSKQLVELFRAALLSYAR